MRSAINKQGAFFKIEKAIEDSGLSKDEAIIALKELDKSGNIFLDPNSQF